MKKTIVLLLALLLAASGLSVFAEPLVDQPYAVKMKAEITAGEGITTDPELPGDRPGEIENGKGLSIVVGRSASKQTLGAEYTNADSLVTLEQYSTDENAIVADLSGKSPNTAAVDKVYFYVAAAAVPSAKSSTTVTFSTNGWVKTENTATPSQANIPITFEASAYNGSPAQEGYNITASAKVADPTSTSATVTVESPYPATSPAWHFVGEVIAKWPQTTGYQVGNYTATITVNVTTP